MARGMSLSGTSSYDYTADGYGIGGAQLNTATAAFDFTLDGFAGSSVYSWTTYFYCDYEPSSWNALFEFTVASSASALSFNIDIDGATLSSAIASGMGSYNASTKRGEFTLGDMDNNNNFIPHVFSEEFKINYSTNNTKYVYGSSQVYITQVLITFVQPVRYLLDANGNKLYAPASYDSNGTPMWSFSDNYALQMP